MPIPDYQSLMLPLLRLTADGEEKRLGDVVEALACEFGLSPQERMQLLESGKQTIIANRTGWARTYLKKAGLLEATRRSHVRITQRGREVLATNPERIDVKYLERFPEFIAFREFTRERTEVNQGSATTTSQSTPEEELERAYKRMRSELEAQVLETVMQSSPAFFERLVVDLLVRMGYGGTLSDAGQAVGKSNDGGIDGIIKEDRLGLDLIYIQAKRWEGTVGRPEIQKFAGALQGQRARKGVFITTSSFTAEARDYVARIESKIVLIDGEQLARFMVEHNVGVALERSFEVKRLDSDYFEEE